MAHTFVPDSDLAQAQENIRVEFALPGLAWAVVPLEAPVTAGASGTRRVNLPDVLTVHDRLHLGSCTKPMTATLIATLIPEDLQWTTRVTDVFPAEGIHSAYHDVTLAHLLAHLSGLPPFDEDDHFRVLPRFRGTPRQRRGAFARWVLKQDPAQPLGEYRYSNAGFGVAGAIAERVTGQAWEDLMRERVFGPLGITSAGVGWPARHDAQQPWGHQWQGKRYAAHNPNGRYHLHPSIAPAGDIHMNILDFATFARAHLRALNGHPGLLPPETVAQLHTPLVPGGAAGLGWGVSTYRGQRASSHSGSADTFLALLLVLPDEGHAFVVVTNAAGGTAEAGTKRALKHLVERFTGARVVTA